MTGAGIAKVISTEFDKAKRLVVKVLFRGKLISGKGDIRTPPEASPYGVDSNPIEGKAALYMKTPVDGKYFVVGYLNTQRLAEPGEARIFSTDADGAFKFNLWLRADGTALIGASDKPDDFKDFLTRFNELKKGFDKLKEDHNDLVQKYNSHVHQVPALVTACGAGAGSTTPAPVAATTSTGQPSTASIDEAKAEKIKTL